MAENNVINKQTEGLLVNKASGDPFVNFQIASTDEFVIGVDDDDSDALKINQGGASPSAGTNTWKMTAAGELTMPTQSAFKAHLGTTATNVTGDGTSYTAIFNTEIYDQNADYNNATGVYTCPVTSKCQFNSTLELGGLAAAHTSGTFSLVTSNYTYIMLRDVSVVRTAANTEGITLSGCCEMDAADTAYVTILISGGALAVDVILGAPTFFDGTIFC